MNITDNQWKSFSHLIGLVPLGALFGLVAYTANMEIKDLDLWLHIAVGRYIVATHSIPQFDILSNSFAGNPWINHEWLFQVIAYWLYNSFGPDGLIKMQIVIVLLTMAVLLFLGYSKDRQLLIIFILLLVFNVFQTRFTIRPELYSLLFFALYIFTLALHIDKRWSTWFLFFIQVLWSNMHGFFFFGPLFILIALASEWLKRNVPLPYEWNQTGRLTDKEYGRLKWILLWVVLACFINPSFVRGAWYPLGVYFSLGGENKIFFDYIQELIRPITWATLFDVQEFTFYKLLVFFSGISFIFNRRRIDISALLIWLVFLIFSLRAARNIAFFAFAAYLVIMTNMASVSFRELVPLRFTRKKFQYLTEIVAKLLLLLYLIQYCTYTSAQGYFDFQKYETKSNFGGVSLQSYPEKAVDFLVANNIKGNFFNDFNSGAYLLGRAHPNIKVFIDGRTEVYGGEFFKKYQSIWEMKDTKVATEAFEKYNITGALLSSVKQTIPPGILNYFYDRKEWALVYFDYDAVVFLKYTPENKPIIDRNLINLAKRKTVKEDLFKLGPERDLPYQYYYRAYTLEELNLNDQALEEAKEALAIAPDYGQVYQLIGKIYGKRDNFQKAFENSRLAVMYSGLSKKSRLNLAKSYFDMNQFDGARKQYEVIASMWPNDPSTLFFLAKTDAKLKNYDEATKELLSAHKITGKDSSTLLALGDIAYEQQNYAQAVKFYEMALETGEGLGAVHEKLGTVYRAMGDVTRAAEELEKARTIQSENKSVKESPDSLGNQIPANVP